MATPLSEEQLKQSIRAKVRELAAGLGRKIPDLSDHEVLLESGLLDSASVLELIVWLETYLQIELEQDELNLDNFGSVAAMTEFLKTRIPR